MRKSKKYWVLAWIKDHIENARHGYDMSDYSFGILYKDGTTLEVYGNEVPDGRIIIGENKVAYCWQGNPDDSSDSTGKLWSKDFSHLENSLEAWDEYVATMMKL